MRGIVGAIASGALPARARIAIGNNAEAPGLAWARSQAIPTRHISAAIAGGADVADRAIAEALAASGVGLVVLSGYLRPVGPAVLGRFRVLNIHPGPLPRFGGRGLYGRHVHAAVLAAGVPESAATVHLVDGEYDHGEIIAVEPVPVRPDDTPDTLQARVMAVEPGLFVRTLQAIAAGTIALP